MKTIFELDYQDVWNLIAKNFGNTGGDQPDKINIVFHVTEDGRITGATITITQ